MTAEREGESASLIPNWLFNIKCLALKLYTHRQDQQQHQNQPDSAGCIHIFVHIYDWGLCWGANPLNLSEIRRTTISGKNWLKDLRVNKLIHIFFLSYAIYSFYVLSNALLMFSFWCFSLFLAVLFWCFLFSVPPNPTVSSLFMHTDIASNSTGNNNGTKHTFLRANKMDGDWLNRRLCLRKVPHILSKYGGRGRGREREFYVSTMQWFMPISFLIQNMWYPQYISTWLYL